MINSKSKSDLRPDVAAACDLFDAMMLKRGYKVAYANTLRDDEYQAYLYASGRTRPGAIITYSQVTTFHGAGLAADIYQDAPTFKQQWQDAGFWAAAKEIRKLLGFSELSIETSHMQWSDGGKYSGTQVRSGIMPPLMPLYKEEDEVQTTEITAKMNGIPTKLTSIVYNQENYVRIRDLADAQKDDKLTVEWNDSTKTVEIISK